MAKKKSRTKKSGSTSFIWMIIMLLSGGGLGGHFNPDWPIVGSLVHRLKSSIASNGVGFDNASGADGRGGQGPGQIPAQPVGFQRQAGSQMSSHQRPDEKLLIASFNIQVFGQSKLEKPNAMAVIVQAIRQFDVIAIQEVRAKDDNILPELVALLNADGSRYAFLIGPRLGRTVSTEQYAFVFDTTRVEHDPSAVGTVGDPADLLHREPFAARFRTRTAAPDKAFTFWLVNTHTDPDDVPEEVAALADVFRVMLTARPDEDDVILLGDLNASETQLGPIAQIPGIRWAVGGGVMTNTRQNKAYDNLIFHGPSTTEYTGRWGVFNLEQAFGLTREAALQVSDHYPVWAEFSVWEGPPTGTVADRFSGAYRHR